MIAVPLDENRQPCGEPFLALTRNISRGGIAILHSEGVTAPYLLLRIETGRHKAIQTVVQVVRTRSFYQFTEISGRFELKTEKKRPTSRSRSRRRPRPPVKQGATDRQRRFYTAPIGKLCCNRPLFFCRAKA